MMMTEKCKIENKIWGIEAIVSIGVEGSRGRGKILKIFLTLSNNIFILSGLLFVNN